MQERSSDYFQDIYLGYAPALLAFARKFVAAHIAEDIIHDVFLKFWDKGLLRGEKSVLKPLLYTAVRNACIDYLRRQALSREIEDKRSIQLKLDELDYYNSPDEIYNQKLLLEKIMVRINELPERNREIFRLSYFYGFKSIEIAERLNISIRTVENQLYRALLFLKQSRLR